MKRTSESLKLLFEKAYTDFHTQRERNRDPVQFSSRYQNPQDQEVVAFLSALLSYGSVSQILSSVEKALLPLGPSPADFIKTSPLSGLWNGFNHRFTQGVDIEMIGHFLKEVLLSHGSIESCFVDCPSKNLEDRLSFFVNRFWEPSFTSSFKAVLKKRQRNLKYLLSDPKRGSACKRLNLFLRWVVRPADGIDLGIWSKVHPQDLILPVDTHILKILRALRWTSSQTASWKVALAATERLREIHPEDPIRYDFALCHLSMSGYTLSHEKVERRSLHQKSKARKLRSSVNL